MSSSSAAAAHHTVIAGTPVVEGGELRGAAAAELEDILARHEVAARRLQGLD